MRHTKQSDDRTNSRQVSGRTAHAFKSVHLLRELLSSANLAVTQTTLSKSPNQPRAALRCQSLTVIRRDRTHRKTAPIFALEQAGLALLSRRLPLWNW